MNAAMRPQIRLLDEATIQEVIEEAKSILHQLGFYLENNEALEILRAGGAKIDTNRRRVFPPPEMVEQALASAPPTIDLYDTAGEHVLELGGDNVCFDPGSAALNILDPDTGDIRPASTPDFVAFSKVVDQLEHIKAQSTAMICGDVPQGMADRYRLYLALLYCRKPVVTGTFVKESFALMRELLVAVRGSAEALREKPLAVFDACPSPPLKWSDLTCQSLIDAARAGIPSEFVSMPLTGATAPITLLGAIVQHAAETLAGIVITQSVEAGSPVIWGGSPSAFDMRRGTTPMGSIGTMMIDLGYAEIGKHLNLPTHAYLGMSDSKLLDAQSGLESGMGSLLAGIKGINMVSGAGMMNFESTQSIQKLVIDNEICGMTYRFLRGISRRERPIAFDLIDTLISDQQLLDHEHTLKWFKSEHYLPSSVIDRSNAEDWLRGGKRSIGERARERAKELVASYPGRTLDPDLQKELTRIMKWDAEKLGLSRLPDQE
ncbi:MAG: trimethylamine methyltransferase family protein [Spirochaetaceae bacterium]|nr:MAG: trimethylamine methyltransferase family protein [Spirochaetaceae bacterium]